MGTTYVAGVAIGGQITVSAPASTLHSLVGAICSAVHHTGKWPVLVQENDEYRCTTEELRAMARRHREDLIAIVAIAEPE